MGRIQILECFETIARSLDSILVLIGNHSFFLCKLEVTSNHLCFRKVILEFQRKDTT